MEGGERTRGENGKDRPLLELVGRELCLWREVFSPTAPTAPSQSSSTGSSSFQSCWSWDSSDIVARAPALAVREAAEMV